MSERQIVAEELSKTYRVPVRGEGLRAALKSVTHRAYQEVPAVRGISFSLARGEMVGLIGPNGAGKTTVLKMLSGLLHPTSGSAQVASCTPWERRDNFLRQISMVLGNKSQMLWDIPPLETFRVLAEIYRVPLVEFRRRLAELVELLEMGDLLRRPVRSFSLGERMKCELVAGLLHHPAVLFLDEPTLGLDILMQGHLRQFITEYNRRSGCTVILTSHYMADVVALCPRALLIHEGRLIYDGRLADLSARLAPFKLIKLTLGNGRVSSPYPLELPAGVDKLGETDGLITLRVERAEAAALTSYLLNRYSVSDLVVEDPPLEAVIDRIFRGEAR